MEEGSSFCRTTCFCWTKPVPSRGGNGLLATHVLYNSWFSLCVSIILPVWREVSPYTDWRAGARLPVLVETWFIEGRHQPIHPAREQRAFRDAQWKLLCTQAYFWAFSAITSKRLAEPQRGMFKATAHENRIKEKKITRIKGRKNFWGNEAFRCFRSFWGVICRSVPCLGLTACGDEMNFSVSLRNAIHTNWYPPLAAASLSIFYHSSWSII